MPLLFGGSSDARSSRSSCIEATPPPRPVRVLPKTCFRPPAQAVVATSHRAAVEAGVGAAATEGCRRRGRVTRWSRTEGSGRRHHGVRWHGGGDSPARAGLDDSSLIERTFAGDFGFAPPMRERWPPIGVGVAIEIRPSVDRDCDWLSGSIVVGGGRNWGLSGASGPSGTMAPLRFPNS